MRTFGVSLRPLAMACALAGLPPAAPLPAAARPAAATHVVATCDDDGPGSLRAAAAAALDGDTIDLSGLACSTISLTSGAIVLRGTVDLRGPGAAALAVDGGYASRVFDHQGPGRLGIYDLALAHGKYSGTGGARGGCVRSDADVVLVGSRVEGCAVLAEGGDAAGGGLSAGGQLLMRDSVLSGNVAAVTDGAAQEVVGGGAAAATLVAKYSAIEDNSVLSPGGTGYGGGFWADGSIALTTTTVSGNWAAVAAGLAAGLRAPDEASIVDCTISGNEAAGRVGGALVGGPLSLANSTVAFNVAAGGAGGVHVGTQAQVTSTILAGNGALDLDGESGAIVSGAANLIRHAALPVPADTIALDPHLQPLAANGGRTRTHALGPGSPALDAGSNPLDLLVDQRGGDFLRTAGAGTDIGAFEVQVLPDRVFEDGFD